MELKMAYWRAAALGRPASAGGRRGRDVLRQVLGRDRPSLEGDRRSAASERPRRGRGCRKRLGIRAHGRARCGTPSPRSCGRLPRRRACRDAPRSRPRPPPWDRGLGGQSHCGDGAGVVAEQLTRIRDAGIGGQARLQLTELVERGELAVAAAPTRASLIAPSVRASVGASARARREKTSASWKRCRVRRAT